MTDTELAGRQRPTARPPEMPHMRILLHDYGGYAFIAELARELAGRGHDILHVHSAALRSGKGHLVRREDDAPSIAFSTVAAGADLDRYNLVERVRLEREYAAELMAVASAWGPDIVVCANTPLLLLRWLQRRLRRAGIPLMNWLQDLHSVAMREHLAARLPAVARPVGNLGGRAVEGLEARLLRSCAMVVPVSGDFGHTLRRWRVPEAKVHVFPNWAELRPPAGRRNPFSARHGLDRRTVLLYAGTLGLKHDPRMLLILAETFRHRPAVAVVVVSEGPGRKWLEAEREASGLDNLLLIDFQPYTGVADMLGTGDVLLSMIRPGAGRYSAPSKVLSYLVAGRAQLAALPADNLSARLLRVSGAGVVVPPTAEGAWIDAATRLVDDPERRRQLGRNGRNYAEAHFDIGAVADRFEAMLVGRIAAS